MGTLQMQFIVVTGYFLSFIFALQLRHGYGSRRQCPGEVIIAAFFYILAAHSEPTLLLAELNYDRFQKCKPPRHSHVIH